MTREFQINRFSNHFKDEAAAMETGLVGWTNLVMKGYGFEGDEKFSHFQFDNEYCYPQESKLITLSKEGFVVASLVLAKSKTFSDYEGAYGVHGIVVLPEFRNKGLGKFLYEEAARLGDINLISGDTKTPSAVLARARGAVVHGMRTFYGYWEVTTGSEKYTRVHQEFIDQFLLKDNVYNKYKAVLLKDTELLQPNIPELEGFPQSLQKAFQPVIESQRMLGQKSTAVLPLLSIREELLK